MNKTVVVQIKNQVFETEKWMDVSEPLSLPEAQLRMEYHQKQYPKNKYRIKSR